MKLPFVSRKKYDKLMCDYEEVVYKFECLFCHATGNRLSKHTEEVEKHIVLEHVQKSMFVERELGLRMAKRVLLSKLEEFIGVGDPATILFEVKPLPLEIAQQLYPEELEGRRPDGQYVVNCKFVTREEWLEEFHKNCFVLRLHARVDDGSFICDDVPYSCFKSLTNENEIDICDIHRGERSEDV